MPSPTSLVTRLAFAAQAVKGTFPLTNIQSSRAISVESVPQMEYIENENHMIGIHQRSTAAQSVPERSSVSVPTEFEVGLYPLSLAYLLFGIGCVSGTPVIAAGVTQHKFVKSNVADSPYITQYLRMGQGTGTFTRQVQDVRLSQLEITLNRTAGCTARGRGMGLNETVITEAGYTVLPEADTEFMPFLGGMIWDTIAAGHSNFNFGVPREHTITIDRTIEEDDQLLHTFYRNDNQEMSFAVNGQVRGLELSIGLYNELLYGGVGSIYNASLGVATVITGLTLELNTSRNIPAATTPYKFILNIPKAEIRIGRFSAQGNQIIRAEAAWKMIDDATTPPMRIELHNAVASYPYANTLFTAAGGTVWTLPDATP